MAQRSSKSCIGVCLDKKRLKELKDVKQKPKLERVLVSHHVAGFAFVLFTIQLLQPKFGWQQLQSATFGTSKQVNRGPKRIPFFFYAFQCFEHCVWSFPISLLYKILFMSNMRPSENFKKKKDDGFELRTSVCYSTLHSYFLFPISCVVNVNASHMCVT